MPVGSGGGVAGWDRVAATPLLTCTYGSLAVLDVGQLKRRCFCCRNHSILHTSCGVEPANYSLSLTGLPLQNPSPRGVAGIVENLLAPEGLGFGAPTLNSFLWGFKKWGSDLDPLCATFFVRRICAVVADQEDVLPHQLGEWRSQNPSPPCCQHGPGVDNMARVQAAGLVQMQLSALSRYRPKGVQIHCPNAQKPLFGRKMDHLMDSVERLPSVIII